MADPAVDEIDALLSLVSEDWRIRCLEAERKIEEALELVKSLEELNTVLNDEVTKLLIQLKEKRELNRYEYEKIARDKRQTDAWYHGWTERNSFKDISGS